MQSHNALSSGSSGYLAHAMQMFVVYVASMSFYLLQDLVSGQKMNGFDKSSSLPPASKRGHYHDVWLVLAKGVEKLCLKGSFPTSSGFICLAD